MIFKFSDSGDMLSLPKAPLLDKLGSSSENEIKILLYAAAAAFDDGSFDEKAVQKISGLDLTDIIIALQFWRGAGVLTLGTDDNKTVSHTDNKVNSNNKKNDDGKPLVLQKYDIPEYSGAEIDKLFEENPELRPLLDECNVIAGKLLNNHETNKIIAFYDYLNLSCEYILSVFGYCKTKYGKTTVHYLEKTIFGIYNDGIDTDEKLREYFKYREEFDNMAGLLRRLFGIGTRSFTKKEEMQIAKWKDIYKVSAELLEYAYEETVNTAAKPTLAYMGRILDSWYKSGITTVEQAKEASVNFKKTKEEAKKPADSSFDNDEFFNAALKKSYENIGKASDN